MSRTAALYFRWCDQYNLGLATIWPLHVSAYIESKAMTAPSVNQQLAALRGLFNWLVIKEVIPENRAMFIKGSRFSRQVGITPIMKAEQMRQLLDSIKVTRKVKIPAKHVGGSHRGTVHGWSSALFRGGRYRGPEGAPVPVARQSA
jgi:site-specific recombinase XerD